MGDVSEADCAIVLARGDAWLHGELSEGATRAIEAHLAECPPCARALAGQRRFLDRMAEAGREPAPECLRRRVATILASSADEEESRVIRSHVTGSPAPVRRRIPSLPLAAAAVLLTLLAVARPWREPAAFPARSFAADHALHAESAPSAMPFPAGARVPPPPHLAGRSPLGLSHCVIDGADYAHYVYSIGGETVSAFVPLGRALPSGTRIVRVVEATVVEVGGREGSTGAVLVADGFSGRTLAGLYEPA